MSTAISDGRQMELNMLLCRRLVWAALHMRAHCPRGQRSRGWVMRVRIVGGQLDDPLRLMCFGRLIALAPTPACILLIYF